MNFQTYSDKFRQKATDSGFSEDAIIKCIAYAQRLFGLNLPVIYNLTHFSHLVGIKRNYIIQAAVVSKYSEAYYRYYKVPKKNGNGFRIINEPLPNLKMIQYWILNNILEARKPSSYAKAYIKKSGIKNNVRFHKNQKVVCSFDIENFFDNITFEKTQKVFIDLGYSEYLSKYFAKLCCLRNSVPQGAPTSPYISNLVMNEIDDEISNYCRESDIRYTRYADDLTFSGDFDEKMLYNFVKQVLNKNGFNLNDKTKVMYEGSRQIVTGVVVNKKIQLPREIRREIRREIYSIRKFGLKAHMEFHGINQKNYLLHLIGKVSYGLYINKEDKDLRGYLDFLKNLQKETQ